MDWTEVKGKWNQAKGEAKNERNRERRGHPPWRGGRWTERSAAQRNFLEAGALGVANRLRIAP